MLVRYTSVSLRACELVHCLPQSTGDQQTHGEVTQSQLVMKMAFQPKPTSGRAHILGRWDTPGQTEIPGALHINKCKHLLSWPHCEAAAPHWLCWVPRCFQCFGDTELQAMNFILRDSISLGKLLEREKLGQKKKCILENGQIALQKDGNGMEFKITDS